MELYRITNGSNYHISEKALRLSEKKLRLSSLIDLTKNITSVSEQFFSNKKITNQNYNIDMITTDFISIFSPSNVGSLCLTDPGIIYYITGFCVKKILKNFNCKDCELVLKSKHMHEYYSSLMQFQKNREFLCLPSALLMQKMICIDFILHSLCFGIHRDNFFKFTNKFDLILKLCETQIQLEFNCVSLHSLRPIVEKIFRLYVNIFLSRLADFKNDFVSAENIRKLNIFECDYSPDNPTT